MTRNYEGLFILNTAGKEDTTKDIIERLEKEIQQNGGKTSKIERMDKRSFARVASKVDSGYYVNFGFEMDSASVNAFRDKLKLDEDVYRVVFFTTDTLGKLTSPEAAAQA